jgi:CXXX repeat peptide maturase
LKFLIIPIDRASIPFCYYGGVDEREPGPIPLETLTRAVAFAQDNGLTVNYLYGRSEPPASFGPIMESVSHAEIVPFSLAGSHPRGVVVVGPDELEEASRPGAGRGGNLIVRYPVERLQRLPEELAPLARMYRRINLCLLDLEKASDSDLELYGKRLERLAEAAGEWLKDGIGCEMSFLTDRMQLDSMRNCEAGLEHLTVGPEGCLYVCPGFLFDDAGQSVGDLACGPKIPNKELLEIGNAAICSICDAYQCKRCVYLNKKLTLEMNTPSRQQCVASHLERNTSARLLSQFGGLPPFSLMKPIPRIDYLDPLDELLRRNHGISNRGVPDDSHVLSSVSAVSATRREIQSRDWIASSAGNGTGAQGIEELLLRICRNQEEILDLLKRRCYGDK